MGKKQKKINCHVDYQMHYTEQVQHLLVSVLVCAGELSDEFLKQLKKLTVHTEAFSLTLVVAFLRGAQK